MTDKNVQSMSHSNAPGCPWVDVKVGDVVVDDLTSGGPKGIVSKAAVLEIWKDDQKDTFPVFGLKLDSTYLDGLRHPWEITNLAEVEESVS